jgi:glutamate 5-kinase
MNPSAQTTHRFAIVMDSRLLSATDLPQSKELIAQLVADIVSVASRGNEIFVILPDPSGWAKSSTNLSDKFDLKYREHAVTESSVRHRILASLGHALLLREFVDRFGQLGTNAACLFLTRHDLAEQGSYENVRSVILGLLGLGIVPIIGQNLAVSAHSEDVSGDERFACVLATAMQARRLVFLTLQEVVAEETLRRKVDTNGKEIALPDMGSPEFTKARSQLDAAKLVTRLGLELSIIDGRQPQVLTDLLVSTDKQVGVFLPAERSQLRGRKNWLALAAQSRGEITVSTFLAESLLARRPASILLIGVEAVTGTFVRNEVVTVRDLQGHILGRGQVRLSAEELERGIRNRERASASDLFGTEVIHCDYYVGNPELPPSGHLSMIGKP